MEKTKYYIASANNSNVSTVSRQLQDEGFEVTDDINEACFIVFDLPYPREDWPIYIGVPTDNVHKVLNTIARRVVQSFFIAFDANTNAKGEVYSAINACCNNRLNVYNDASQLLRAMRQADDFRKSLQRVYSDGIANETLRRVKNGSRN